MYSCNLFANRDVVHENYSLSVFAGYGNVYPIRKVLPRTDHEGPEGE
jgi:hypothetical protein